MKRGTSLLLAVLLVIQLISIPVLAEENDTEDQPVSLCGAREATEEQMAYWNEIVQTIQRKPRRTLEEARMSSSTNGTRGWIFRIWEPWAGYIQDSGWQNKTNFIVSCDDLYDVYHAINIGFMY